MLVVLPPSETKVSGGVTGHTLDVSSLSFPVQEPTRRKLLDQVKNLSLDPDKARIALKLGPKGLPEIERNQTLFTSPTLEALSRYTGVLYDALDAASLGSAASWARDNIAIFSALFGLVRATDMIPAYRLSYDSSLPDGSPVVQWSGIAREIWAQAPGFVVDLRSEGYRSLAPVPEGKGVFINLVQQASGGVKKALGHANKSVKGQLVRAMATEGIQASSIDELVSWGEKTGWYFDGDSLAHGRIDLVISGN